MEEWNKNALFGQFRIRQEKGAIIFSHAIKQAILNLLHTQYIIICCGNKFINMYYDTLQLYASVKWNVLFCHFRISQEKGAINIFTRY